MNPETEPLPLRDIHLPDPVSWWPLAPGWWMLLALLCIAVGLTFYMYRRYRRAALQRSAQRALHDITAQWQQSADEQALARELSILLRRLCLSCYPREQVAGLTGRAWLQQLDTLLPGEQFQNGVGHVLIEAPYAKEAQVDGNALLKLCERWVCNAVRPAGTQS